MLVEKQVIPRLGGIPLQKLTPGHLNAAYADMLASGRRDGRGGLSPRTVRYAHTVMRKALADAVKWSRLARNAADSADPPSAKAAKAKAMETWSADELRAFLASVRSDPLHSAFFLSATTGMRRGEVLGLRWRDLDLGAGRLAITQTLIAPDYKLQFSEPKTDKGRRAVDLDPATVEVLRTHKKRQLEERLAFGPGYAENDLVFRRADGSPVHPYQFSQAFGRRTKDAGLPKIRLHDLRHTYATLALRAGEHPKVVSDRLGHSSIAITMDTYSHAVPGMQRESAARVAALILGDA